MRPRQSYYTRFSRSKRGPSPATNNVSTFILLYDNENINPCLLHSLHDPFSLQEVRHAVFSCAPDKAPGPDGVPLFFYQRFWGLLKDDIMELFHKLHCGHLALKELNRGWLCLCPKKKTEAIKAGDCRPICLINGMIKIVSKVLANRLQLFLDGLVNPFQTAFIKSRSILDKFYMVHILSHHLYSSNQQMALFKIDFERAFDHINWLFLVEVLLARGFSNKWIGWIRDLLQTSSNAVLLNGIPGEFFLCKRGIRQGDPLPSLLFILCVDVLFRMFQRAVSHSLLPAVGVGDYSIHTLQFADDLLLFFDGNFRSAEVIKVLLDAFSVTSGLKINFSKSFIVPINLESVRACNLAQYFGCSTAEFPFTYLGLPLSPKPLRRIDYLPLIEKVDKRLAGWKGRQLSRAGRLVLVNFVLTSIPTLFCSAFRIPAWVIKEVDKIRRGFFWKEKILNNGLSCLVNWEHVCCPKRLDGLGIRNMRATNSALLMKNFWKLYSARSIPWVRIVNHKHYRRRLPCAGGKPPPKCSPIWKGVLTTTGPFHTSAFFTLGDGASASFWYARWSGDMVLRYHFPNLFTAASHKHLSVSKWLNRFIPCRSLGFGNFLSPERQSELLQLNNLVRSLNLTASMDTIFWRWNFKGNFSTGSAYLFLVHDGVDDRRIRHLWNIKIPLRIKIFLWLVARNRLPTADFLANRGWIGPSICPLCRRDVEYLDHLLFRCSYSREVWSSLFFGHQRTCRKLLGETGDLATRWRRIKGTQEGSALVDINLWIAATCWELWKERNNRIFENRCTRPMDCGKKISCTISLWRRNLGGGGGGKILGCPRNFGVI